MATYSVNIRAAALILCAFLSFNIADALLKAVVNNYHFGSVGFYPLISYLIALIVFSKQVGGIQSLKQTNYLKLHLYRGIFNTVGFIGFLIAIAYITLAQTYTLVLTSPFWVVLFSIFFLKKIIGWHRWLAIIIGFIGVLVVLQPWSGQIHLAFLGAIACGIGAAGSMLIARRIGEHEPLINMVFFPLLVPIVTLFLINTLWKGWEAVTHDHMMLFALSGIVFLIADFLFSKGFAEGETDFLAPLHYSQIVWGALIGFFFFNETPDSWTIIGAAIIVLSGIYLILRENQMHKK
jgi:S-adenosylmethionine uptake transporter